MPELNSSGQKHKHKKNSGKSFLILPVMFFVVIYGTLYLTFAPIISSIGGVAGLFFSDNEKNYSEEYRDIFVPLPDDDYEKKDPVKKDDKDKKEEKPTQTQTQIQTVPIEYITYPRYSDRFGELIINECGIDAPLFMGDGNIALRYGVGIYYGSNIPGSGGTILVAGHNNTYFNNLKNADVGQTVEIKTSYGNYFYEITAVEVRKATDPEAYDLAATYENLVMYTCYPFNTLGLTNQRCFVYASLVQGPAIIEENNTSDNQSQNTVATQAQVQPTQKSTPTERQTEVPKQEETQPFTEVVTEAETVVEEPTVDEEEVVEDGE